ncbi:tyrosine-type recombinase/integrase [Pseudomonas sp. MOB-449]|nr:tyrosine-type recombinase/integrase [Pseudomonas sp. MOB-449]
MAREKIPEHTERATTFCRNAEHQKKQYELPDSKVPSLELRISADHKRWSLRYKIKIGEKWESRRATLGYFPALTVAAARSEALKMKAYIAQGGDPAGERKAEADRRAEEIEAKAREAASRVTVKELFERWMKSEKPRNRKDKGAELRRQFEKDVIPVIGEKDLRDLDETDIHSVTDAMIDRGVNRIAQSVFSDMKQMFKYAVKRKIIKVNPAANIEKTDIGTETKPRERVLSLREIRQLDQALWASSLNRVTHIIYMLQIAMTCRINELCQASWSQISWDSREWKIPAKNTKSGRAITVSLSAYSIGLLRELHTLTGHTLWLYPGQDESKPINRKAAINHARDRQRPEGEKPLQGRTIETRSLVIGDEEWKTHDLRRSGSTLMQRLGVPTEVSEKCLNHVEDNKVKKIYHQYEYDREMKRAWYLLSEALSVITGPDGEAFLKEVDIDRQREPDEEIGMLALVKKYYKKPDERYEAA